MLNNFKDKIINFIFYLNINKKIVIMSYTVTKNSF